MRLIDADGLIRDAKTLFCPDVYKLSFIRLIDSTKTVEEITNEDVQNAIKLGFHDGYEMAKAKYARTQDEWIRKEDIIHLLESWADGYSYIEIPTETAIKEIKEMKGGTV